MKLLVLEQVPSPGETIALTGDRFHYLVRVRRNQIGDVVPCTDGQGETRALKITEIDGDRVVLQSLDGQPVDHRLFTGDVGVSLWIALLKGKKLDHVIRQATELGVTSIHPVSTRHCVSRPGDAESERKRGRWQQIAVEASQQSGRTTVPRIESAIPIAEVPKIEDGISVVFHERARRAFSEDLLSQLEFDRRAERTRSLVEWRAFVGPEGGFADEEIQFLIDRGWISSRIDSPVLRAETAAIVASALVLYLRKTYTARLNG